MIMIHYIYKIYFLCEEPGNYYIGKRSYAGSDITKDKYCGSGRYCDFYFKKHGIKLGETYTKEIIEINSNKKINSNREMYWVGDLWNTDPLCKNLIPGGNWSENDVFKKAVIQYDLFGNEIARYESQLEAASSVGLQNSGGISKCCILKSLNNESGGYVWRFETDPLTIFEKDQIIVRHMPVQQFSKNGELINVFNTIKDASDSLKIDNASICACCNRIRNSAGGFIWRYAKDVISKEDLEKRFYEIIKIQQFDLSGNFIATHSSLKDAAKSVNGNWQHIQKCCNRLKPTAYGYIWRRDNDSVKVEDLKRNTPFIIQQWDLNGNLLAEFDTIVDAAKNINRSTTGISKCCDGKKKSCGGFIWKRIARKSNI